MKPERAANDRERNVRSDDTMRPTNSELRGLFAQHRGLRITDIEYGDPDEVQITFKLKAGWSWSDFL